MAADKSTTKKKRAKRTVTKGVMHILSTYNNTIVSIADMNGNVISSSTAGACGFRGSRKSTAYAAQITAERALNTAVNTFGLRALTARVSGVGMGRDAALRAVAASPVELSGITDITSMPFGGCRRKRMPRK
jgi:small subunit ribosomal protein S11